MAKISIIQVPDQIIKYQPTAKGYKQAMRHQQIIRRNVKIHIAQINVKIYIYMCFFIYICMYICICNDHLSICTSFLGYFWTQFLLICCIIKAQFTINTSYIEILLKSIKLLINFSNIST